MALGAVTLMLWPLIIYGYNEGELYLAEAILLGFIWPLSLGCVLAFDISEWYFAGPATVLTIYAIIRVLGPDAKTWSSPSA